jgi:hypothetical protein
MKPFSPPDDGFTLLNAEPHNEQLTKQADKGAGASIADKQTVRINTALWNVTRYSSVEIQQLGETYCFRLRGSRVS